MLEYLVIAAYFIHLLEGYFRAVFTVSAIGESTKVLGLKLDYICLAPIFNQLKWKSSRLW